MDITLLIVLASAIIVIILSIAFFVNSRRTPKGKIVMIHMYLMLRI